MVTTDVLLLSRLKTNRAVPALCVHVHSVAIIYAQDKFTFHIALYFLTEYMYTDMRRLAMGMRSEKCVVRRFRRCAIVIECTYTNLDSIAYYTPRLYGIAYCS